MSLFKLGLVISASYLLSGCIGAVPQLTAAEQEMSQKLEQNQYQPATREIRNNIETQEILAQAAFWSHEYNLNPADLESAIKFSAVLRKMGNPGRAVEVTRTSRALYPRDPYLNAEHAAGLIANQQARPAMKILDNALKETPAYGRLWSLKGVALDQMEKYAQARPFYNRALQITPNDPNIMANMGLNFALSGDPHTARQWLLRAANHPNASDGVHANLELVESLVAQAGPQPHPAQVPSQTSAYSASQAATAPQTTHAQTYRPQNYAPQNHSGLAPQSSSAPRQYGAYQSPQTARTQYAAPPARRPAAQTFVNPHAVPPRPTAASPYQNVAPSTVASAGAQQAVPTSRDVLSRIAKNVGPKAAATPQVPNYIAAYEGRAATAPNIQPQAPQNYPGQQSFNNRQQIYNNAPAPNNNAPQLRGGYPAPQAPYYSDQPQPQNVPLRRQAARRRG